MCQERTSSMSGSITNTSLGGNGSQSQISQESPLPSNRLPSDFANSPSGIPCPGTPKNVPKKGSWVRFNLTGVVSKLANWISSQAVQLYIDLWWWFFLATEFVWQGLSPTWFTELTLGGPQTKWTRSGSKLQAATTHRLEHPWTAAASSWVLDS